MIGVLLRVMALVVVYLLVLTSLAPGDVAVGAVLALGIVAAGRPVTRTPAAGWRRWLVAAVGTLLSTGLDMVVGTARTVRFALGRPAAPGFVEIPRAGRSPLGVALWGLLTGEAPDEYPVDVDDARGVLLVHVLDARDPVAIRARHARTNDRWQRDVVD